MPGAIGNENARKWLDKDLKKIADKVRSLSPEAVAIVCIIVELGISQDQYYHLVSKYPIVAQAHKYAKSCIAAKAWKQSFEGKGFPNILTLAIKRHDTNHLKHENEDLKAKERIKGDEKIRTQTALVVDNKDMITDMISIAAQAIQDTNAKKKRENA